MGDAESLRHAAGVLNVLAGAAGALAANRLAMVVELKRDADHVIALTLQKGRDHGGVDPSGHGDDHPGVGRTPRQMKAVEPVGLSIESTVVKLGVPIRGLVKMLAGSRQPRIQKVAFF